MSFFIKSIKINIQQLFKTLLSINDLSISVKLVCINVTKNTVLGIPAGYWCNQ